MIVFYCIIPLSGLILAGVVLLMRSAKVAPTGFENETGFHFGDEYPAPAPRPQARHLPKLRSLQLAK